MGDRLTSKVSIRHLLIILFCIMPVIDLSGQVMLGLSAGPNLSKFIVQSDYYGGEEPYSQVKTGITSTLAFEVRGSGLFSLGIEAGYNLYQNQSKKDFGSMGNPSIEDGNYTHQYLSFGILPHISISRKPSVDLLIGLSYKRLMDAYFTGKIEYLDPDSPYPDLIVKKFSGNVTSQMKVNYLFYEFGLNYRYELSNRLTLSSSILIFSTINAIEYRSSKTPIAGGSLTAGLLFKL